MMRSSGAVGLVLMVLAGCTGETDRVPSPSADGGLVEVDLALNWFPEAEHGGFYAAEVHGYFADEGLKVNIRPGGPNVPVVQNVAAKRHLFGIANADAVLLGRAQEADVVAVMAPLQVSPRCIMVHADSGIRRFEQLENVTLAMSSAPAFSYFLRKRLPLDDVQIVPYAGSVAPFLHDPRYAQQGYVFSEPFVAREQGADPVSLLVADLGFNPYTSTLITHADTLSEQPELVGKIVRASVRGWQKYLEDPEPANRRIHERNAEMSLEILAFGVPKLRPLCLPDGMPPADLGTMTAERWQTLCDQLVEIELIPQGAVSSDEAFSTRFLPTADPDAQP